MSELARQFGQIDIYLFYQLLRGRIARSARVLDAGCGDGRNLIYLVREGYDAFAIDDDANAIGTVRRLAASMPADLPESHLRVEPVERMTFPDRFADIVISSAVLHFARDDRHFGGIVSDMWRVLKPGGLLFCRVASTIGIENRVRRIGGRRFHLPDGSTRYLVDEAILLDLTRKLGGEMLDPLKTTVVQDQRSMTTWVVRKGKLTSAAAGNRAAGNDL